MKEAFRNEENELYETFRSIIFILNVMPEHDIDHILDCFNDNHKIYYLRCFEGNFKKSQQQISNSVTKLFIHLKAKSANE